MQRQGHKLWAFFPLWKDKSLLGTARSCCLCLSVTCLPSESQAYVFPHVCLGFFQAWKLLRNGSGKSLLSAICGENNFQTVLRTNVVLHYYITTESKTGRRRGWSDCCCRYWKLYPNHFCANVLHSFTETCEYFTLLTSSCFSFFLVLRRWGNSYCLASNYLMFLKIVS